MKICVMRVVNTPKGPGWVGSVNYVEEVALVWVHGERGYHFKFVELEPTALMINPKTMWRKQEPVLDALIEVKKKRRNFFAKLFGYE